MPSATMLDDFTMTVEFTVDTLPSSGNYARLFRVSTTSPLVNPIVSIWINGTNSKLYAEVHNNAGSGDANLNGSITLTTATRYRATLRKLGTEVRLFLNGVQESAGTHAGALTGLTEWSAGNSKGLSASAA